MPALNSLILSACKLCVVLLFLAGCASVNNLQNPGKRSGGTAFDDLSTETVLRRQVIIEGNKHSLRIRVKAFNRYVLLVGETENLSTSEILEVKAAQVKGVRRVFNRIKVSNPLPSYNGFDDVVLGARVGFTIAGIKELDKVKIGRIVDRKNIYLMGLVTQEQANILTETLSKLKDVKEIITLFEYI